MVFSYFSYVYAEKKDGLRVLAIVLRCLFTGETVFILVSQTCLVKTTALSLSQLISFMNRTIGRISYYMLRRYPEVGTPKQTYTRSINQPAQTYSNQARRW